MIRKFVSLVLAMLLLCGTALAAPDYLNTESQFPIVKDGEHVQITLTTLQVESGGCDADNCWLWPVIREKTNIDLQVTQIPSNSRDERRNLMFAADELPDIMFGFGLSTAEIVKYGQMEGQLLPLNDYINETYMPNFCAWLEELPSVLPQLTAPDGNIYALPRLAAADQIAMGVYINQPWLQEAGLETPTTLDEFIAMLRAFKAAHPDSVPLGGSELCADPRAYILGALGFLTADSVGLTPALYHIQPFEPVQAPTSPYWTTNSATPVGDPVIPAGDPLFLEYLKVLHTLYVEGLISPDFFTIDATAVRALMAEGLVGVTAEPAYAALPSAKDFQNWWSAKPLTSQWNATPIWLKNNRASIGNFVVSAKTEHPEVIARMADWWFTPEGAIYQWYGPMRGSEDATDTVKGWYYDENGARHIVDVEEGRFDNEWMYIIGSIAPYGSSGFLGAGGLIGRQGQNFHHYMQELCGYPVAEMPFNMEDGDSHARASLAQNTAPYTIDGFPSILYFTEEESTIMSDLKSVIEPYVKSEIAKFITGARPLSEFDAYLEELDTIGFRTYEQYYIDAYNSYLANQ